MKDEALKLTLEALENAIAVRREHMARIKELEAQLAQPAQEPAFKWHSVFQEMPAENSHILFCFGVHIVEGSFTKNGWASLAYGTAQPDFWAYFPPPPHHKRNQELYAMPPKRPWVGLTDADIERIKLMTYEKETNADGEEQEAVNIDWLIKTAEHFCKEKNNG